MCTSQAQAHSGSGFWILHTRLGLHFVPSPSRAAQGTRSLTSALSPGAAQLPSPSLPQFPGALVLCTMCLFWGADLWLQPSQQISPIQNLRKSLVRNLKPVCSLVGEAISGAEFTSFWLWLAPASPLPPAGDGPVRCR